MGDWRLIGQEEYLMGGELFEIDFPEFWKEAYDKKNAFYQIVLENALQFVKEQGRGEEYLKADLVRKFWHQHCVFCTETINTDDKTVCYCTKDYNDWICQKCFKDFREKFNWQVENIRNIENNTDSTCEVHMYPFFGMMAGSKIVDIHRVCDLVIFKFKLTNEKYLFFHIQCFIRIFDGEKLVICTQDMFHRSSNLKKWKKFDWSKTGNTLFDDTLTEYKGKLLSSFVEEVLFKNKDVRIVFENKMIMEILAHITEAEDPRFSENYRVFDEDEEKTIALFD